MRFLFQMTHPGFVRNFEAPLRELGARGHEVVLSFRGKARLGEDALVEALCSEFPTITIGPRFGKDADVEWRTMAEEVRFAGDYLRYLHPVFEKADALRARAAERAPAWAHRLFRSAWVRSPRGHSAAMAMFRHLEAALPVPESALKLLRKVKPDAVVVTPMIQLGSPQVDVVKAARLLRIPSILGVASWDNLTNKGVLRAYPDRIVVWNEFQRQEGRDLHGFPPERVDVCGAWTYDHWFDWEAGCTRGEFLQAVGLSEQREYLLYVCSSPFIAPHEVPFVRRWVQALRSAPDERLRDIGILVRPHPQNAAQWEEDDLADLPNVVVWPRAGANPINRSARDDYFRSLRFSRAIVGINTSAQIEAGILAKPVFTVAGGEFASTQEGTLHFQHLTQSGGGLVSAARSLDEHVEQLSQALASEQALADRSRAFVATFLRPSGRETAAAPLFADALERATRSAPAAVEAGGLAGLVAKAWLRAQVRRRRARHRGAVATEGGAGSR